MNRPDYPEYVVFYTTFRCNSHCKACNIWKGNDQVKKKMELNIENIKEIFSNSLFRKVRNVNVQGGEATLREDLPQIIEILIQTLPKLTTIGLTSNGLDTELVIEQTKKILKICKSSNIKFNVGISVDGVGKYHDYARGENAFKKASKTINQLKKIRREFPELGLGTNCVITAKNVYNIDQIESWQKKIFGFNNISVVEFRDHFLNQPETGNTLLFDNNEKETRLFISWLDKKITEKPRYPLQYRYNQLKNMLLYDKPRTQSCQYLINSVVVTHRGVLQDCPIGGVIGSYKDGKLEEMYFSNKGKFARNYLKNNKCSNCYPYNFYEAEFEKDLVKYLFWRMVNFYK